MPHAIQVRTRVVVTTTTALTFVVLKLAGIRVAVLPVLARPRCVHVLDRRVKVGPDPGVVHVPDAVLFANGAHRRGNVRVPGRRHAGEQVVFHLKVEAAGQVARNGAPVRARRFHLRLEPAHLAVLFRVTFGFVRRIAVGVFKIVRQRKERRQCERFGHAKEQNVADSAEANAVELQRPHHVHVNVQAAQRNGVLAATAHKGAFHFDAVANRALAD